MLVTNFRSKCEVFGAVIAVIGSIVVVTRGINAPITYDESYSIQTARISRDALIAYNSLLDILWLSVAWILRFGDWEFGYRLLRLVSFGIFSGALLRLMRGLKSSAIYFLALIALFANPLLIEFCSLLADMHLQRQPLLATERSDLTDDAR